MHDARSGPDRDNGEVGRVHSVPMGSADPETRVMAVDKAQTDLIDLRNVTRNSEVKVHAFVSDAHVQFDSSPLVSVKLTLEKTGRTSDR